MKKSVYGIIAVITLFICNATLAQEKRDTIHYNSAAGGKVKLKNELGLTKKQAKTLKASNQEFRQQAQTVKSDSTLSRQEKKERLKKLMEARQQKMDSLLTPEQQEKAKELRKGRRAKKTDE